MRIHFLLIVALAFLLSPLTAETPRSIDTWSRCVSADDSWATPVFSVGPDGYRIEYPAIRIDDLRVPTSALYPRFDSSRADWQTLSVRVSRFRGVPLVFAGLPFIQCPDGWQLPLAVEGSTPYSALKTFLNRCCVDLEQTPDGWWIAGSRTAIDRSVIVFSIDVPGDQGSLPAAIENAIVEAFAPAVYPGIDGIPDRPPDFYWIHLAVYPDPDHEDEAIIEITTARPGWYFATGSVNRDLRRVRWRRQDGDFRVECAWGNGGESVVTNFHEDLDSDGYSEIMVRGGEDQRAHDRPDRLISGRTGENLLSFQYWIAVEDTTSQFPTVAASPPFSYPIDQDRRDPRVWRFSPDLQRFHEIAAWRRIPESENADVVSALRALLDGKAQIKSFQTLDPNRSSSLGDLDPCRLLALVRAGQDPEIGRVVFAHIGSKVPAKWCGPPPLGRDDEFNLWREGFITRGGD